MGGVGSNPTVEAFKSFEKIMIHFQFFLSNPWRKDFKCLSSLHGKTWFPNKFYEIEIRKCQNLLMLGLEITLRTDHAGIVFEFGCLYHEITFHFYDNRHWNDEKNCWEIYDTQDDN